MPTYRKITNAEYEQDSATRHRTNDDERTGTVTVYYSNGTNQEFANIARAEYFAWESRGFDWHIPPEGVTTKAPEIVPELEDEQAEIEELELAVFESRQARKRRMFMLADNALRKRLGEREYTRRYGSIKLA